MEPGMEVTVCCSLAGGRSPLRPEWEPGSGEGGQEGQALALWESFRRSSALAWPKSLCGLS